MSFESSKLESFSSAPGLFPASTQGAYCDLVELMQLRQKGKPRGSLLNARRASPKDYVQNALRRLGSYVVARII